MTTDRRSKAPKIRCVICHESKAPRIGTLARIFAAGYRFGRIEECPPLCATHQRQVNDAEVEASLAFVNGVQSDG